MTRRTRVPEGLDPILTAFLDDIAKPAGAVTDLSGSASSTASSVTSSAITSVATTGATNSSPYGYTTAAQADAIVTAINSVITRQALLITAVNTLISDMAANAAVIDDLTDKINETLAALRARGRMDQ